MISTALDKELISQPELWKLTLLVSAQRLDVALYPPVPREEMIWRSFELDASAGAPLKALEDIIYANPLLLSDFKSVDCLIDNTPEILLPAGLTTEEAAMLYRRSTVDSSDNEWPDDELELYPAADEKVVVALRQNPEIKAFLRRTFYNIRFNSRLALLSDYLLTSSKSTAPTIIGVFTRNSRLTLIALRDGDILLANNLYYENNLDALYYILAVRRLLGLDPQATPIITSPVPQSFTQVLREHVTSLGAIPFPMLRFRTTPATLQAPFELLIQSICE